MTKELVNLAREHGATVKDLGSVWIEFDAGELAEFAAAVAAPHEAEVARLKGLLMDAQLRASADRFHANEARKALT